MYCCHHYPDDEACAGDSNGVGVSTFRVEEQQIEAQGIILPNEWKHYSVCLLIVPILDSVRHTLHKPI